MDKFDIEFGGVIGVGEEKKTPVSDSVPRLHPLFQAHPLGHN